ncbi:thiol:disulfide interchange protein DsbA/DsbL [Thiobaca trueperi]|uniref:Thiol:disulfide interchange protein n=1 Tax=Thiobaca trueperi TaxID=127458 RepID=A0A4V2V1C6_9GAMM|nr:thiol:disulfide interchange protein DsbA/DsbL [Thiobaca trueperi]TCT20722.1 thiol:disulfide interchange protein DsbA [Thiobaca trueperi]
MTLNRRRFNQFLIGALGASMLPTAGAELVQGQDWRPVDPPQPGDAPGKIEVLEFFSYGCPHCSDLNPLIDAWVKELPADVAFRRVPVSFGRAQWANLSRLYFALDSTDNLGRLNQAVFDALHKERVRLFTKEAIIEWIATQGVDTKAFAEAFDSFDVQTQLSRSDYLVGRYLIDAVPTIAVAGRYVVISQPRKGLPGLLTTADALIAKARAEGAAG